MGLIMADRKSLSLHFVLVLSFFVGALLGALAFGCYGYVCALPLAAILGLLCLPSLALDLETRLRLWNKKRRRPVFGG
jgi:hypothetical protein